MNAITITSEQGFARLGIILKNSRSPIKNIDGQPEWNINTPGKITVLPQSDGMSADILYIAPGVTTLTVKITVDGGTRTIEKSVSVTTTAPPVLPNLNYADDFDIVELTVAGA